MSRVTDHSRSSLGRDHHLELVRGFPLRPIRSGEELMQAIAVINALVARALDDGGRDYLDVLPDIVEKYETDGHPMPPVSDAEMLRHLIEARGIKQAGLAADTGVPDSTISEVLNGRRQLTGKQVATMARYFGVNPGVFSLGE
jgi:HTH-type transcriptional regulator/antitoxin HigA